MLMKTKFTTVPCMAILFLVSAFGTAFSQENPNFRNIDNFEPPTAVSLWWTPNASGSTTGIILEEGGNVVTYRVSDTEIFNPASGSTMSMKLGYKWDANRPLGAGSHLIRQHLPESTLAGPVSDAVARRFLPHQAIEVFVHGDGSGNRFRFMTREKRTDVAGGQLEGSQWFTIDWTGWRRITWRLSEDPVVGWVNGNGVWSNDYIVFDSFQLTWSGQSQGVSGAVYFDDLRIVDPFGVNFTVQDAGGNAVADASININGKQYAAGSYNLNLFPGSYTYFVKKSGFVTASGTFTVDKENLTIPVVMTGGADAQHTLAFTVFDVGGELVTNATIKLNDVAGTPGNYFFTVPPGFYNYEVTAPNYFPVKGLAKVVNSNVFVNVEPTIYNAVTLTWRVATTAATADQRLEKYSVWVSKKDAPSGVPFNPNNYEMVFEETLPSTIGSMVFQSRSANLAWHHSKDARVAFRHHDVTGMDRIVIDDVRIVASKTLDLPATVIDENFDAGVTDPINPQWLPEGWLAVDFDNDGHNWFFGATAQNGYMLSRSGAPGKNTLTPNNWLLSKQITLPVIAFYNLTFDIKDHLNNTVEGAMITLNGKPHEPGNYVISVPDGTHQFVVSREGFVSSTGTATVFGSNRTVVVTLQPTPRTVVFNVDMRHRPGGFTPGDNHTIFITGNFPGVDWAAPGSIPASQLMSATDNVFVFTKTMMLPVGTYSYKYFDAPSFDSGEWPGSPNRQVTVTGNMTVNDWFGHIGSPTNVDIIENAQVRVFPNPARSNINITSGTNIKKVSLIDMLGQVVYSAEVNGNSHIFSINSLRAGVYFVKVYSENGVVTQKVQVQK